MKIFAAILGFLLIASLGAFFAWCGGFNFDTRNTDVGFGVMLISFFSMGAGFVAYTIPK